MREEFPASTSQLVGIVLQLLQTPQATPFTGGLECPTPTYTILDALEHTL